MTNLKRYFPKKLWEWEWVECSLGAATLNVMWLLPVVTAHMFPARVDGKVPARAAHCRKSAGTGENYKTCWIFAVGPRMARIPAENCPHTREICRENRPRTTSAVGKLFIVRRAWSATTVTVRIDRKITSSEAFGNTIVIESDRRIVYDKMIPCANAVSTIDPQSCAMIQIINQERYPARLHEYMTIGRGYLLMNYIGLDVVPHTWIWKKNMPMRCLKISNSSYERIDIFLLIDLKNSHKVPCLAMTWTQWILFQSVNNRVKEIQK